MGPVYYRWEKYHSSNNSWINPSHRAVNITSPNLMFNVITEEDEGFYHCLVANNGDIAISNNATVYVYGEFGTTAIIGVCTKMFYNVNVGPPIINFISNHTVSQERNKTVLTCIAINDVDAIHPVQIKWYKGNILVIPSGKHIILYNTVNRRQLNSTLLLDPVNRNDGGEYICRAFNHNDTYSEAKVDVTVECKITIILRLR